MGIHGIGCDVVEIQRIWRVYQRYGNRFLYRYLHPLEVEAFQCTASINQPQFLASRWAVKEATYKCFPGYRMQFPDCVYQFNAGKQPTLAFYNHLVQHSADLGITGRKASISHDGDYAMAFVILECGEAALE